MLPEIPESGYSVILVDCPWRYQNWSDNAHGAARSHYRGMKYGELAKIPVSRWASDDAVIFQWATWPKLDQAVDLIRDWEFKYITGFPWVKIVPSSGEIRRGIGFWAMAASEMLLIGRRGKPVSRKLENQVIGLMCGSERQFYAPIRKHSQKPMAIHDYVEERFDGPYLEIFATQERDGWSCWGHDTGWHVYSEGVIDLATAKSTGLVPLDDGEDPPPTATSVAPDPVVFDHLDAAIMDF